MTSPDDNTPFDLAPMEKPAPKKPEENWGATELATRFVPRGGDTAEAQAKADPDIGKAVGANTWELFVSCAPADALAQQFDARSPVFIALHDLGGNGSRRLLMEVAQQLGTPVKRLVLRRQGFGTELATLYFADVKAGNGQLLRLYSGDIKADEATRFLLLKLLLSRCQMAGVVVNEMPAVAMESAITALGQALQEGRRGAATAVVLPLTNSPVLEPLLAGLSRRAGVQIRRAPRAKMAIEGWPFLASTWNHLQSENLPNASVAELMVIPVPRAQSPASAGLPPSPAMVTPTNTAAGRPALPQSELQKHLAPYAQGVVAFRGVVSCCVFNARTLALQAQAGAAEPPVELLVRQGRMLVASMQASSQVLGLGKTVREGLITLDAHMLVLRLVPGAPNMVLLSVLRHAPDVDLAAFRAELARLDGLFKATVSGGVVPAKPQG